MKTHPARKYARRGRPTVTADRREPLPPRPLPTDTAEQARVKRLLRLVAQINRAAARLGRLEHLLAHDPRKIARAANRLRSLERQAANSRHLEFEFAPSPTTQPARHD